MRIDPLDFAQARVAPEHVARGLELLDPTACIVHFDDSRWMVGKIRHSSEARIQAVTMLDTWTVRLQAGVRRTLEASRSIRFAQLALLGFRPVQQYDLHGAPDSRIVRDFAMSRYRWLHESANEPLKREDVAREAITATNRADLADIGRARDAWQYAFTRSHHVGGTLTPQDRAKSGWVRHSSLQAS